MTKKQILEKLLSIRALIVEGQVLDNIPRIASDRAVGFELGFLTGQLITEINADVIREMGPGPGRD